VEDAKEEEEEERRRRGGAEKEISVLVLRCYYIYGVGVCVSFPQESFWTI
jgi:hypothetical protein